MSEFWTLVNTRGSFNLLNDFNFSVQTTTGMGLPPVEIVESAYGSQDGSYVHRIVYKARPFRLIGDFGPGNQGTYGELLTNRLAFENEVCRDRVVTFESDGSETITPFSLQFLWDGQPLRIDCFYQTGLEGGKPIGYNEEVAVEFFAPDPFFYDPTADTQELNVNSDTTVDNAGTTKAYPILTLTGEGELLSLANSTIGLTIAFAGLAVLPGETLTLDLSPGVKTLTSDVRGNLNNLIAQSTRLTSWHLAVDENTLLLSAQAEQILQDEDVASLLDENSDTLLNSNTLDITSALLSWNKRYNSINGVVA